MTGLQVLGVALIALGVAYASVYVGWLRRTRRVTLTPPDRPVETSAASPVTRVTRRRETASPTACEPMPEPALHAGRATRGTTAVDAAAGVPMRYLGTMLTPAPRRAEAKGLATPADGVVRVTADAVTWRPARGTALRCEARGLRWVVGLAAAPSKPLVVTWQAEATGAHVTHETTFLVADATARAAVATALRALLETADLVDPAGISDPNALSQETM